MVNHLMIAYIISIVRIFASATASAAEIASADFVLNTIQKGRKRRTRIFCCDPSHPYQKGAVENNHELIRRVIPKGHSFDLYEQEDITLMMNHINSYGRRKLNDRSPYSVFSFLHGTDVLQKLDADLILADDIILNPTLLVA